MVKNMLHRKLFRDLRKSAMQFAALILLCMLATFAFSGIDGIARMIEVTNQRYFTENNLSDYWITLPAADRAALAKVRSIDGVAEVQARFSMDMETDLNGEPTLNVTACDGEMTINRPIISEGQALDPSDPRGCLMEDGFARAQGLRVGDTFSVRLNGWEYRLIIRGLSFSPEYIYIANGANADTKTYGYVLANACAFANIPLTQLVVTLEDDCDEAAFRSAVRETLPAAFLVDRTAHPSTMKANDNVTMFGALSIVFPLAAYAVAALIVMATLTRMIDNQRMQIGTLKALGFSSQAIERHYLSYALVPSLIGAFGGVLLGHFTLPDLLWTKLVGNNEYPYRLDPPVSYQAWLTSALLVVLCVLICLSTFRRSSQESTAALLRPKPPKSGKRIVLERFTRFWSRLGFNSKMVLRNLFRNKLRTIVSCVGLLCCNMLLIASLGLQDSIKSTVMEHYGGFLRYDVIATLNAKAGEADAYASHLDAEVAECVMDRSVSITHGDAQRSTLLTVVQDGQQLIRLPQNSSPTSSGTILLTEKLADMIGASVGDSVTLCLVNDDEPVTLTVSQLVESNLAQGAYLSETAWRALRKGAFTPTSILLRKPTDACLSKLADRTEVTKLETAAEQSANALSALDMVSSIFLLLMFIALALAFVICYNMGLINFAERTREYATLKVLGYHQREIRRLILNENLIITVIAIALSIWPSIGFTSIILRTAETEACRYATQILPQSIAVSCVVTLAFSMFIQSMLVLKVRTISMVEALKSVE